LQRKTQKLQFFVNQLAGDSALSAYFYYRNSSHAEITIREIFQKTFKIYHVPEIIEDLCVLKNNLLVAACSSKIVIYTELFQEIKSINCINGQNLDSSCSVDVNDLDQVYICNYNYKTNNSQIFLMDNQLNYIKHFDYRGRLKCIRYKNGYVYAGETVRRKMITLDKNLEPLSSKRLSHTPFSFTISDDDTICIRCVKYDKINMRYQTILSFYSTTSLDFKTEGIYTNGFYTETEFSTFFYALNSKQMTLRIFNWNGVFIEMINLTGFQNFEFVTVFKCLNGKFYMIGTNGVIKVY
jgi:hypothetical protein